MTRFIQPGFSFSFSFCVFAQVEIGTRLVNVIILQQRLSHSGEDFNGKLLWASQGQKSGQGLHEFGGQGVADSSMQNSLSYTPCFFHHMVLFIFFMTKVCLQQSRARVGHFCYEFELVQIPVLLLLWGVTDQGDLVEMGSVYGRRDVSLFMVSTFSK